jgi:misacylated tRNA(Ala) deacylase
MTEPLFREDAYLKECNATVVEAANGAIVLNQTNFYAMGGGQPGDTGSISWEGASADVIDTRYGDNGEIRHVVAEGAALPAAGATVTAKIDWDRRYRLMRMHTGLHLIGAVLQYGVTGGSISEQKSRLDFDMEDPIDKEQLTIDIQALVDANQPISCHWITDEELAAQPELVRTMSVQPPKGAGKVRLLKIKDVDLQPCGGTHLKSTSEVGAFHIGKVEKKGRHNRRVNFHLD